MHRLLMTLLVMLAAVLSAGRVLAQGEPLISATPGVQPDAWVVNGQGFTPGARVYVNQIPCGVLPCGAGPMAGFQEVTVGPTGEFTVYMQLHPEFEPHPGVTWRLIAAYGADWSQSAIDAAPSVRIPLHHPGSPEAPLSGTGLRPPARRLPGSAAGAGAALCGLGLLLGFAAGTRESRRQSR